MQGHHATADLYDRHFSPAGLLDMAAWEFSADTRAKALALQRGHLVVAT